MKLKSLTRAVAAAGVALVATAGVAAAQIQFTTTGLFSSSGTNVATFGTGANTVTLTFNGAAAVSPVSGDPFSFVSFGNILATGSATATDVPITGDLTITIQQLTPTPGTGVLPSGTLTGTLSFNQSTGMIMYTSTAPIEVGGSYYSFAQATTAINAPNVTPGAPIPPGFTTIQGQVSAIPEPATVALLGTGLAALGLGGLRRRARMNVA